MRHRERRVLESLLIHERSPGRSYAPAISITTGSSIGCLSSTSVAVCGSPSRARPFALSAGRRSLRPTRSKPTTSESCPETIETWKSETIETWTHKSGTDLTSVPKCGINNLINRVIDSPV